MISVCMATYNGEEYIKEQLESILCQLGEMDEIIISDDGSTDNTLNIIESYNDSRIKFILTQENMDLFIISKMPYKKQKVSTFFFQIKMIYGFQKNKFTN